LNVAQGVDLVIFGASGDLAQRKILPSLKRLVSRDGMVLRVIGVGRAAQSTTDFRDIVKKRSGSTRSAATAEWVKLDYRSKATFAGLKKVLANAGSVVFYLATPPETFSDIIRGLGQSGLATAVRGAGGRALRVPWR
jgi:glucose-6-phosphate 1-dehydrogenase